MDMSHVKLLKDFYSTEMKPQGDHDLNQLLVAPIPNSSFVFV